MKEMNNNLLANETSAVESAVSKDNSVRRRFIMLIAILTALALLTAAFAVFTFVDFSDDGKGGSGSQTGEEAFDYFKALLSDYIALTEGQITGLTIPGYDSRVDQVTDENVDRYINTILLNAVALSDEQIKQRDYAGLVKWSQKIDYADDVFLYIAYVEKEDGTRVDVKFFENAYMDPGRLQIGMQAFGEDFDNALVGLCPMNVGRYEKRVSGSVSATDTVVITYMATETIKATEEGKEDTVKNHKNYEGLRLELSRVEDTAWLDALLANYGTIGQYFSFEYEEDVDDDGVKETLKYEGVIDAVVTEEELYPLEVTLPEDFFGENPEDESYAALNGATLTFYINIDHMVPHEANTVDTLTKADIDTINAFLSESGAVQFKPSNDISKVVGGKEQKGELTTLTDAVATLKATVKTLEGEIETLKKSGEIEKLEAEIAALEAEIADLEAAADAADKASEITAKKNSLATKRTSLENKKNDLSKREATLSTTKAELDMKQASLDAAIAVARTECQAFFKTELESSYAETVKSTAGQLVYEYLVKNLEFTKLPESEVKALEQTAKSYVEYYYDQLTAAERRNYRDIEAFAAVYFGYEEKDYNGYIHYIESYLAPYEVKMQLLLPGIYNTFINDEAKLNAKIEEHIADIIKLTTSEGTPLTRDEILKNYAANGGENYLRDYYAMPLVVYDYLAEKNNVDFTLRDIENK